MCRCKISAIARTLYGLRGVSPLSVDTSGITLLYTGQRRSLGGSGVGASHLDRGSGGALSRCSHLHVVRGDSREEIIWVGTGVRRRVRRCYDLLGLGTVDRRFRRTVGDTASCRKFLRRLLHVRISTRRRHTGRHGVGTTGFPCEGCVRSLRLSLLPRTVEGQLPRLYSLSFVERDGGVVVAKGPKAKGGRATVKLKVGTYRRKCHILCAAVPCLMARLGRDGDRRGLHSCRGQFRGCSLVVTSRLNCVSFSHRTTSLLFAILSLETSRGSAVVASGLAFRQ